MRIGPIPASGAAVYLSGILVLCKSLGAALCGIVTIPVLALLRPRWQLRVASLLAIVVVTYPMTRSVGLFPKDALVVLVRAISEERAESLSFRFENEDLLLEKARKRIWFGWGGYNRNRVFDSRTGQVDTITDGFWIIQLGTQGVVGFIGAYGILLFPIWIAHRRLPRMASERDRRLIAGFAMILAIYAVDLIPNGFLTSFSIFLAGALSGLVSKLQVGKRSRSTRRRRSELNSATTDDAGSRNSEALGARELYGECELLPQHWCRNLPIPGCTSITGR
jgi:hypothetical protein